MPGRKIYCNRSINFDYTNPQDFNVAVAYADGSKSDEKWVVWKSRIGGTSDSLN